MMSAPSATARVIRRDPRTSTRDFSETGAARRGRTTKVLAPPLEFPLLEFLPRGAAPRRSAAGADATDDMARGRFGNLRYTQRLSAVYGDAPREGLWRPKRDGPLRSLLLVSRDNSQQKKKIFSRRRLASPSPRLGLMNPQIRNADKELKKGDSNCEKARQIRLSSSLGLRWFPPIFFVSRLTGWSVLGGHRCRSVPTAPRSDSMRSYRLEGASRRRAANRSLRAGPR